MRLSGYIVGRVFMATLVCAVVLLGLGFTFEVIDEVGNAARDYGFGQAVWYSLLKIPAAFVRDLPLIGLLGALTGLGSLAGTSELVAARAAGLSLARIVLLACVPGFALGVGAVGLSQWWVPVSDRAAESYKDAALGQASNDQLVRGLWHRFDQGFINLDSVGERGVSQLRWFEFSDDHELNTSGTASDGQFDGTQWQLQSVQIAQLRGAGLVEQTLSDLNLPISVSPGSLRQAIDSGVAQRPSDLWRLRTQLAQAGLSIQQASLSLYKVIFLPLLVVALVFAGAGFVLGPLRSSPLGTRLFIGILVGLGFKLLQDISGPVTLVYGFQPILAVVLPGVLAVLLGAVNLRKT